MTRRMGTCGQDIPLETQFLTVEAHEGDDECAVYTFFLPILEEDFRAILQGNERNELEICLESVDEFEGSHLVFVGAGLNPFDVITKAVKIVERHLQTFSPPAEWFLCCCSVIIWALFNIGVQGLSCVRSWSLEACALELAITTAISLGLQLCHFLAHCACLSHNVVQWCLSCFINQSI